MKGKYNNDNNNYWINLFYEIEYVLLLGILNLNGILINYRIDNQTQFIDIKLNVLIIYYYHEYKYRYHTYRLSVNHDVFKWL